ncbi:MAG: septum formation initiator family protein [Bacteroidales bacterium]|nr:septum formation initiator family protein [Bacteroidales bacterium]
MKNDIKKSFATLGSNKYAMAVLVFVIWLVGIDDNSIHRRVSLHRNVMELKERKEQLKREIEEDYRKMEDLRSVETLEKFAREEYYMKAPNEVVFIVK